MRRWSVVAGVVITVVAACAVAYFAWPREVPASADHDRLAAGESVTLHGGTTVTVPLRGWSADHMTYDGTPAANSGLRMSDAASLSNTGGSGSGFAEGTMVQAMTFSDPSSWDVETVAWGSEPPPVAYESAGGTVQVRWRADQPNRGLVLAAEPGLPLTGVYFISPGFKPTTLKALSRKLDRLWTTLGIEGVELPTP